MKSKLFLLLFVLLSISMLTVTYANAAEDLSDGWQAVYDPGPVSFSPSGETLNISAGNPTSDVWGKWYKRFNGAVGALATINISSTSGTSNAYIGVRKYIGQLASGNYIVADINVRDYFSDQHIWYRVRERNQSGQHIRLIAMGYLGDFTGFWTSGENIDVGVAYVNGNIAFYTSKTDALGIVRLPEPIYMSSRGFDIEIQTLATAGPTPVIQGSLSNMTVIYADDLGVFEGFRSSDCDVNQDGKTGVEEAIHILQGVSGIRGMQVDRGLVSIKTEHDQDENYALVIADSIPFDNAQVSGPNVSSVTDIDDRRLLVGVSSRPLGLSYSVRFDYSDGNYQVYDITIGSINDNFATITYPTDGSTINTTTPTFTWNEASGAVSYTILVEDSSGPGQFFPWVIGLPAGTTSVQYDSDGQALAPLESGKSYLLIVHSYDVNGNQATVYNSFTVQ